MGLKAIKGATHRKRAHLYFGQQRGNINNACWDRSHGQAPPLEMGTPLGSKPPRDGNPPEMEPSPEMEPLEMGSPGDGTPRRWDTPLRWDPPWRWDHWRWDPPSPLEMGSSGEYGQMIRKL